MLEAIEAATPQASQRRIALSGSGPDRVALRGDHERLGQALDNLVSNAVKYTPEGGSVTIDVTTGPAHCRIEVTDTGIGIPLDEQDHVFDRFFRSSSATDRQISGVGLGLVIAKAVVEGHGGTIGFTSEPAAGSTFWFELPLSPDRQLPEVAP
jgi:signal transduction histidine kinase